MRKERTKPHPYTCPSCGLQTRLKADMNRHLYTNKKPCASVSGIILTDEIKEHIMNYRLYTPRQTNSVKISRCQYVNRDELTNEIREYILKNRVIPIPNNVVKEPIQSQIETLKQGYIYLIIIRESLRLKESVLKFGCTKDIKKRCTQYPKGSQLLYCQYVDDYEKKESEILKELNKHYKQRKDYGLEYFEGDSIDMTEFIKKQVKLASIFT
jgi:hypothetical protein